MLVCPPPCLQHSHTGRNVPWPLGTTGQWEPSGQWSRAHWSAVVSVQLYSGQCVTSRYIPDNFTVWRNVYSRFSIHWHQLRLGHGAGIKWSQECVSNMSCGRQLCNYSSVAGQLIISCFLPQKQQQWYVDCRNGGIEEKVRLHLLVHYPFQTIWFNRKWTWPWNSILILDYWWCSGWLKPPIRTQSNYHNTDYSRMQHSGFVDSHSSDTNNKVLTRVLNLLCHVHMESILLKLFRIFVKCFPSALTK